MANPPGGGCGGGQGARRAPFGRAEASPGFVMFVMFVMFCYVCYVCVCLCYVCYVLTGAILTDERSESDRVWAPNSQVSGWCHQTDERSESDRCALKTVQSAETSEASLTGCNHQTVSEFDWC